MTYRKLAAVLAAIACAATGQVAAKEPTLEEILRPPTHELFTVSPDGERIAATMRVKGRMMLVIADRRTLKAERVIDPEERGDIASVEWVSPTRLFLMNSRVGDRVEQAYLEPWTIAMDIDGTHKRVISDSIIDTLVDDDDHILVERCGRSSAKGCWTYVEKIGTVVRSGRT